MFGARLRAGQSGCPVEVASDAEEPTLARHIGIMAAHYPCPNHNNVHAGVHSTNQSIHAPNHDNASSSADAFCSRPIVSEMSLLESIVFPQRNPQTPPNLASVSGFSASATRPLKAAIAPMQFRALLGCAGAIPARKRAGVICGDITLFYLAV